MRLSVKTNKSALDNHSYFIIYLEKNGSIVTNIRYLELDCPLDEARDYIDYNVSELEQHLDFMQINLRILRNLTNQLINPQQ